MESNNLRILIGGLDCLVTLPANWNGARKVPAAILFHGRQGRKEKLADIAERLSDAGFLVVCWDAPNHGTRTVDPSKNEDWLGGNDENAPVMYAQIVQTLYEARLVLDFIPDKLPNGLQISAWSVLGISQGGHAALLNFTHEKRFAACVALIGSGNFEQNMRERYVFFQSIAMKKNLKKLPNFSELYSPSLSSYVASFDPINNVEKAGAGLRPLLMLNGGEDRLVSPICNEQLYQKLLPIYQANKREHCLRLVVYDSVKHTVTPDMKEKAISWLIDHTNGRRTGTL